MNCKGCGGDNCIEIVIHLKEEETVQFYSCRRCEARWWEREGSQIDLTEVLTIAATHKRSW